MRLFSVESLRYMSLALIFLNYCCCLFLERGSPIPSSNTTVPSTSQTEGPTIIKVLTDTVVAIAETQDGTGSDAKSIHKPTAESTGAHSRKQSETKSASKSSPASRDSFAPISSPPSVTTPSTTYINEQITLTSAPNWGDQPIPQNNCTIIAPMGNIEWIPCMVFAGTVQLSFFPEQKENLSYPSTYFDPTLSITLTSPSVYMVINTLTAYNDCGRLGPTYKDYILSLDLTDVSTMQPFPDATARDRLGDPRQLTLADLATDCPKNQDRPVSQTLITSSGAVIDPHPIDDDWNRCNPRLMMPQLMKSVGLPYWRHCGNDNGHFGIFDPPGAVPPVQGLFPTTIAQPIIPTSTPAEPVPTLQPVPAPTSSAPVNPPHNTESVADQSPAASIPVVTRKPQPTSKLSEIQPTPTLGNTESSFILDLLTTAVANNPAPSPSVIDSNGIISGSAGVLLPGETSTALNAVTTLIDSNNAPVYVSSVSSGIIILQSGTTSFIANPTRPVESIPEPGATTLVIGGQTLTAGGSPVTLDGTGAVATLGSEELIIQYPSGKASTIALSSTAVTPSLLPLPDNASNDLKNVSITLLHDGAVLIGTQTISLGSSPITLAGDAVLSLASDGLVIQQPHGAVTTLSIAKPATQASLTTGSVAENGVASIIASLVGIPPPSPEPGISSTQLSPEKTPTTTIDLGIASIGTTYVNPYSVTTISPENETETATVDSPPTTYVPAGSARTLWEELGSLRICIGLGFATFLA